MENLFQMSAPCLLGLEGLVADELRFMGMKNVQPENGRVVFEGNYADMARANIGSRYSERILVLLNTFSAYTFEDLFQGVLAVPWEDWLDKEAAFPVKGRSLSSKLASVPDCQKIIKKAVVERMKRHYRIDWFAETGTPHQIQFLILKDKVSIMLDTSGMGLHKRGYRENAAAAPIKETLAAAMADLSHVRPHSRVIDPFCGSGTILIESALKALKIAPGLRRRFAAERWSCVPAEAWRQEREFAQNQIDRNAEFQAYGYDIDPEAIRLTEENAKKAGVGARIHLMQRDIRDFSEDLERAAIICNPPYGERLLDMEQSRELYKIMGEKFHKRDGYSYSIISPDDRFEDMFGRLADKRRKLYNGMIKCQVYMYFKK
ncbi:MAG: class I SAM-dependent RNA methyltransferase [Acutalibacteraceae bacterium]